jgi:hypothetical protein
MVSHCSITSPPVPILCQSVTKFLNKITVELVLSYCQRYCFRLPVAYHSLILLLSCRQYYLLSFSILTQLILLYVYLSIQDLLIGNL